jgi:hypothetical protein
MHRFAIFEGVTLTCPICNYPSEYPVRSAAAFAGLIEHCVTVHPSYDMKSGAEAGKGLMQISKGRINKQEPNGSFVSVEEHSRNKTGITVPDL